MTCVVRLSPLEAVQWRAGATASTSIIKLEVETVKDVLYSWMVVAPCLTVKPHPDWSLVTGPSVHIHHEVLRFVVFFNGKLDLRVCFACWPFSTVLSQAVWQECLTETPESVWVLFPLLGLLELSAGILAVLSPLLDPSKTCPVPVCIPLSLSRLHGVGCGDFRWHWSTLWPASVPWSDCLNLLFYFTNSGV